MTDFANLPLRSEEGDFLAVVETPKGSAIKYEFDRQLQAMTISKYLSLGLVYPFDFGFFPSTIAEDGDPLDVMVLADVGSFAGLVQKVRLLGALATEQKEKGATLRNDRILAVPVELSRRRHLKDARDLDAGLRNEIELFLRATDVLEPKSLVFLGWKGPRAARRLVDAAARSYSRLKAPAGKG